MGIGRGLCLLMGVLMAAIAPLAGAQTVQPLHFFVEDSLLSAAPLTVWNNELLRQVAAAERLLCSESKRVEQVSACDFSFSRAVSVTAFDTAVEDGLGRAVPQKMAPGVVDENGLNVLFDQESPSERRVYVVRRIFSCGGEPGEATACTRMRSRVTVIALGYCFRCTEQNAITLLHELGHQVGLLDGPDPRTLMYRGRPVPRVGTAIQAVEIASFRRLLSPP